MASRTDGGKPENRPIGVFDSGVGGLTVWRAIPRLLPRESLIFLSDAPPLPAPAGPHKEDPGPQGARLRPIAAGGPPGATTAHPVVPASHAGGADVPPLHHPRPRPPPPRAPPR